jgi:hypothetical protein
MNELFLIELYCDETGDWLELEINSQPYPVPGGEADQLVQAGAACRWTVIRSNRPLKRR